MTGGCPRYSRFSRPLDGRSDQIMRSCRLRLGDNGTWRCTCPRRKAKVGCQPAVPLRSASLAAKAGASPGCRSRPAISIGWSRGCIERPCQGEQRRRRGRTAGSGGSRRSQRQGHPGARKGRHRRGPAESPVGRLALSCHSPPSMHWGASREVLRASSVSGGALGVTGSSCRHASGGWERLDRMGRRSCRASK